MPRRREIPKRAILPDPKYSSVDVAKFVNVLMQAGKKSIAEGIIYSALEQIKKKTDPNALFLNAPTYNSPVVLSGRPSVMRYSGHLSSYGIDFGPRETDVKQIYQGGGVADILLKKYDVEYVLFTPEERDTLKANEEFFKKYPVLAESGQFRVYKVK